MHKKVIFVFVAVFSFQLINSCIFKRCGDPETYEINYTSVSVIAFNTAGFTNELVTDSVYKNAFGLEIYLNSDFTLLDAGSSMPVLGFSSVMAFSCAEDNYIYMDPLAYVQIFATDTETGIKTEVTTNFGMHVYDNEYVSLEQFFNERAVWHDAFQFDLIDFNISNSVIFTLDAYLVSGSVLTSETQQINFYN